MRLRLTIEYEGTRYRGWQEQRNARTVAGELRRAIGALAGRPVELAGAGRTDAGVHALAQVAHVDLPAAVRIERWLGEVNERLPSDIHLRAAERVPARFHARHAAESRSYLYQLSRRRTALAKRFVWWVRRPLDAGVMARAAELFVGRHDFAAFCEKPGEQISTLVVVERCELVEEGELLLFRVVASHFLWKMVRRLVGALVEVGGGDLDQRELGLLLARGPATSPLRPAEWTAPPSGLFLERVLYPGEPPLGALHAAVPVAPALASR
jgi:tRNA pseudouridine38-40 synthase